MNTRELFVVLNTVIGAGVTLREHEIADIERGLNREWWLGAMTAASEFWSVVRLAAGCIVLALVIQTILIILVIQDDPHGAGHTLHAVFSASETTLQKGWNGLWHFGTLLAMGAFVVSLVFGLRRRPLDYVASAWWTKVRRTARVASDGNLTLVLTEDTRMGWRSPHQVEWQQRRDEASR